MNDIIDSEPHRHILSVVLEDYCHVASVRRVVPRGYWHRFESRVQHNTLFTLDLLDEMNVKATFFALGWIADHQPDVIKEVVRRGHEIASKGYFHRSIRQMSPEEFREDAIMSRKALERASGTEVRGYRIATDWFTRKDLWALDILCEEGFSYDTSIRVLGTEFSDEPFRRFPHIQKCGSGEIWEIPLSSWKFGPFCVPFSGGNYVRQLPDGFVRKFVANWDRSVPAPLFFYFHIWELDPDQPRITAAARLQRVRHYRNLDVMLERVRFYLSQYQFSPVADYLKLPAPKAVEHDGLETRPSDSPITVSARPATGEAPLPITVVVPCYNEEATLGYLANTLQSFSESVADRYKVSFVFVDDGSSDRTWERLNEVFGERADSSLVRHSRNRGVAAATLTGINNAKTEIVCAIDCDGTYDPAQLKDMVPMLKPGIDLITASPYHELGEVINAPGWRLFLSRGLSALYRVVLHQKLATYTSCFRVYRASAVKSMSLRYDGFVGITEILSQLDMKGRGVVECPAVMEVRLLGHSKMRNLKTIRGHLALLAHLVAERVSRQFRPQQSSQTGEVP